MGIKLHKSVCPLSCDLQNGIIRVFVGNEVIAQSEIGLKMCSFNKQCNTVVSPRNKVIGIMQNDDYTLIVRNDNIFFLLNAINELLIKYKFNSDDLFKEYSQYDCGFINIDGIVTPLLLFKVSNTRFIIYSSNNVYHFEFNSMSDVYNDILDIVINRNSGSILRFFLIEQSNLFVDFGIGNMVLINNCKIVKHTFTRVGDLI